RIEKRRALRELVEAQRKHLSPRRPLHGMPRAPYPLEERRYSPRRPYLAHEVHVPYVYAQLKRGRSDYRFQLPRLQPSLGVEPHLLRYAPVVRRDDLRPEPLRQVVRHPLREPPRIHEYESSLVRFYQRF